MKRKKKKKRAKEEKDEKKKMRKKEIIYVYLLRNILKKFKNKIINNNLHLETHLTCKRARPNGATLREISMPNHLEKTSLEM